MVERYRTLNSARDPSLNLGKAGHFFLFFIPLPFLGDCSPVSRPTTWLMFATPVRGLELSEILGLFIQICEILSQQWNRVFSLLDVAIFLFPILFQMSSIIFYVSKFSFHTQKL